MARRKTDTDLSDHSTSQTRALIEQFNDLDQQIRRCLQSDASKEAIGQHDKAITATFEALLTLRPCDLDDKRSLAGFLLDRLEEKETGPNDDKRVKEAIIRLIQ